MESRTEQAITVLSFGEANCAASALAINVESGTSVVAEPLAEIVGFCAGSMAEDPRHHVEKVVESPTWLTAKGVRRRTFRGELPRSVASPPAMHNGVAAPTRLARSLNLDAGRIGQR